MRLRSILPTVGALAALTFASAAQAVVQVPLAGGPQGAPQGGPQGGPPGGGMGMLPRSLDQVEPWADRVFARLDANSDGAITGNELTVLSQEPIASMGGGRLRAMVSQSDANRDARVSLEEFRAGAVRAFHRMDTNGDGQLSDDELPRPAAPRGPVAIPMPTAPNPMPMPMPDGSGG